jgi:arylformamidase
VGTALLAVGAFLLSTARAQTEIAYGEDPLQRLDVWTLADTDPEATAAEPEDAARPVVVFVHGGGWAIGSRRGAQVPRVKAPFFTAAGFVFVSIDYRLSPAVRHPAHVEDCAAALAWTFDHIADHGGDPQRVFVVGHSAGAHLAALVATDQRYLAAHGHAPSDLSGVVLLDSASYDLPRVVDEFGKRRMARMFARRVRGRPLGVGRRLARTARRSGTNSYRRSSSSTPAPRDDAAVESRDFAAAVRATGAPARVVHAAELDHAGINRAIGDPQSPYTKDVLAFFADPHGGEGRNGGQHGQQPTTGGATAPRGERLRELPFEGRSTRPEVGAANGWFRFALAADEDESDPDAVPREFFVYRPTGWQQGGPVVLLLHGGGGSKERLFGPSTGASHWGRDRRAGRCVARRTRRHRDAATTRTARADAGAPSMERRAPRGFDRRRRRVPRRSARRDADPVRPTTARASTSPALRTAG